MRKENYWMNIDKTKQAKSFLISFVVFFLYAYIFFRHILISIALASLISFYFYRFFLAIFNRKILKKNRLMLRDFLDILSTGISSGQNFYEALLDSSEELKRYYPKDSLIIEVVEKMIDDLNHGLSEKNALRSFANLLQLEEAFVFSQTLEIAILSGMDLKEMIQETKLAINDQINVELAIASHTDNSKREFIIMMLLPLFILLLLNSSMAKTLTLIDYIVRFFCFSIILFSFYLAHKIINLEL